MYLIGQCSKTNGQYFLRRNSFKNSVIRVDVGVGVGASQSAWAYFFDRSFLTQPHPHPHLNGGSRIL